MSTAEERRDFDDGVRAYIEERKPFDPAKSWEWKRGWMIAWTESNKRIVYSEVRT